jgi:mannosyltransferase
MTRLWPMRPSNTAESISASSRVAVSSQGDAVPLSPQTRAPRFGARGAISLLILAIAVGGLLRFSNLGEAEMSADEGASWAAASASSVSQVLELQPRLNPGKFALHEIALHGWIRLFGDGLTAMRALSALAGTLGIVAVFFLARELLGLHRAIARPANEKDESAETPSDMSAAAFAAVLLAVNLVFIKYAQEARMYSLALLCALIQVGSFLHSLRRPTPAVLLFVALFTGLAIASTFTMVLILAPEVLWLGYLAGNRDRALRRRAVFAILALTGGFALLIPPAIIYLNARAHAPALPAYAWASTPQIWAPLSMFNKATGSIAFPVVLTLALWGIARSWRRRRDAVVFLLLWMLVPPLLVLAGSYLIRPAFVERYTLSSFVPFFLLVALGIYSVRGVPEQSVLLALVAVLASGHDYSYRRNAHDVQWREAVLAATSTTGRTIVVAPPYTVDVVRYYLRNSESDWSIEPGVAKSAGVALVADTGVSAAEAAHIATEYPRLLMRLRGVIVRGH